MMIFAGFFTVLFLVMHWDVKHGAKSYTRTHPMTETLSHNATIDIYNTGKSFYEDLFKDIENAKGHIWIHFFIIRDDKVSNEFFDLLIEKARKGVDVRQIGRAHV